MVNAIELNIGDTIMYDTTRAIVDDIDLIDNSIYVVDDEYSAGGWIHDMENVEKVDD